MKSNTVLFIALLSFLMILFGALSAPFSFSENNSWKFAVLCDTRGNDTNKSGMSGINDTISKALAEEILKEQCDLVLVPGDMINGWFRHDNATYEGQFNNWTQAMGPVYKNKIRIYTVRGNHEAGPTDYSEALDQEVSPYGITPDSKLLSAFNRTFKFNKTLGIGNPSNGPVGEVNLTYSFPHENAFFVGLDEYATPHRVNQKWLDGQLKSNTKPFVFVFGHEPAFQIKHPDCLAYYSANRSSFWNSIGQAGCQIYFCGHDHLYDRAHIPDGSGNNIFQMVVGSCGAPQKGWKPDYKDGSVIGDFHNDSDSGYVLVTMRSNNTALVEWKALNWNKSDWITQDRFNLKGKENTGIGSWIAYILLGILVIFMAGLIYLWMDKARWNKFLESLKGDVCGDYEIYITAMVVYIAIPVAMFLCWKYFPTYHENGMISSENARNVVQGVTIFVVIYFITQFIERIVELISNIRPLFKDTNEIAKLKKEIELRDSRIKERLKTVRFARLGSEKEELEKSMDRQDCLESSRQSRLWAAASGLGIVFSYFLIGLFALVGITCIPHWIDVIVSGIIIGGGSKPLHDLIGKIEKK